MLIPKVVTPTLVLADDGVMTGLSFGYAGSAFKPMVEFNSKGPPGPTGGSSCFGLSNGLECRKRPEGPFLGL